MQFSRIDTALALAKKEAAQLATIDPRLQSFIVGYLVVDIISEFEQRLEAMFVLRAQKLGDKPNANFVATMLDQKFRTPQASKINGILKSHDQAWLDAFTAELHGARWVQSLNNLITNRHYYVHKSGGSAAMTLQDVEADYNEAVKLFDALAHALNLTVSDCAQFT